MKTLILPVVLIAAVLATPALADPIQWTISGVFSDGGEVNGTFIYDNDAPGGAMTAINVQTTAGVGAPILATGATYVVRRNGGSNGFTLLTAGGEADGERLLAIDLVGNMGNAGGTINLDTTSSVEGTCTGGTCIGGIGTPRSVAAGSIVGVPAPVAAVPTMTEWAMIGFTGLLAAAGAVMVGRRRRFI